MNEFVEQFLIEARELVDQATADLLALEHAPQDRKSLDGAFRAFHTLKGGAQIVGFEALARGVHAAEDVLAMVRKGDRPMTARLLRNCLSCVDRVVEWLDLIEETGEVPAYLDADANQLVELLSADEISPDVAGSASAESPAETGANPTQVGLAILKEQLLLLAVEGEGLEGRAGSAARVCANVFRYLRRGADAEKITSSQAGDIASIVMSAIDEITKGRLDGRAGLSVARADPLSRTLRIDAERVNALVNLTGELTIAKNAFGHVANLASKRDDELAGAILEEHAKLDKLIGELQRAVLELRVLPLRGVFQRVARQVRELSESLGKPARLEIEGEDTHADKAIIEMLFEPLSHVIRNAIDHGIESARERASVRKPSVAAISLRGRREGEHVVIEVEDDGAGVDVDRIREVALENGVAPSSAIEAMSDEAVIELIFLPGFSTAADVTALSGRGVGMDAVRASVERLGGHVTLESRRGVGSKVLFFLPFSVMLTRVMTVEAGGQLVGVPLDAVVEIAQVRREQVQRLGHARAFALREQTVPLISLASSLGLEATEARSEHIVVVTSSGGLMGGLEVDRLGVRADVMLKPPGGLLSAIPEIAGTTVMGDGSVLLVLDVKAVLLGRQAPN